MRAKETAIEVKVGALVLLSIAVFTAFIIILGDCNFNPGFEIRVEFTNAAGLKPGAPVRLAGIPAGSVRSVSYQSGERPVKVVVWIEEDIRDSIRKDAQFIITTQGVLGEPYVEITSVDQSLPAIEAGENFIGTDPPRMDMLLSSAYKGIEGIRELVERLNRRGENIIRIDDFINNIADLAHNIDERVVENKEEIDSIITNIDQIVGEIEGPTNRQFPAFLRILNQRLENSIDLGAH
jgi:ABC-type transporter Mla subunit MlaD